MYANFFGFHDLPFQLTPDHRFFFGSSTHNKALAHLTFGISQGEGFIVVTGEVGAGKTTLLGHLLSTLDEDQYVASSLVTSQLQGDDVLRLAAINFGIDCDGLDKAGVIQRIEDFLVERHDEGKRCLLMVDEAQNLSVAALEELRMLSNLQADHKPLLQSFLLAQPQFKAILARPDLEQLRQRVIAAYHLGPLNREETKEYVCHRLHAVGWDETNPGLTDGAFVEIFEATGGIPRLINNLCSRVLLYACLEEMEKVNADTVRSVAEDQKRETAEVLVEGAGDALPVGAEAEMQSSPAALAALQAENLRLQRDVNELTQRLNKLEGAISHGLKSVLEYFSGNS
ncbi:XrtA/PEP-CTERM system-associated ATPase [Aestuariispira insulae]|uniref:Putative secretion ATPase (PEP-CTERM system associated) n=1 Tax=Aestuariispira insulae TaxID=1461337 RepID=A0A3D9HK69_9PROT|nr:XrtA/PEP-CTERM system-associated ATPase [Aestuariispira insulae]RED49863.1 putative secretion ATPase (PEP-CTERM system associated) [Aestuariispira insulae]